MNRAQDDRQTIEKPLDRLNYYNGQRLEARDLCLEQAYHMRMRRWLNKSLYADGGIVNGLEVIEQEGTPAVVVTAGLALDTQGREIILLEDTKVDLPPTALVVEEKQKVAYLTIRYDEHATGYEQEGCTARSETEAGAAGSSLAWSGPALVRAEPVFAWRDAVPPVGSDEIALARVVLTADCKLVENVDLKVRQLADKPGDTVRQFALEGFRDVAPDNPARIYFHIRGRQPTSVTLYLRAERFPPLYYTELAQHIHTIEGSFGFQDHDLPPHTHTVDQATSTGSEHEHGIWMRVHTPTQIHGIPPAQHWPDYDQAHQKWSSVDQIDAWQIPAAFNLASQNLGDSQGGWYQKIYHGNTKIRVRVRREDATTVVWKYPFIAMTGKSRPVWESGELVVKEADGGHSHSIGNGKTGSKSFDPLTHTLNQSPTIALTGVELDADTQPRTGKQLTYVNSLQVLIDDVPQTTNILTQIQKANPTENWNNVLGDGTRNHPFVVPREEPPGDRDGTGPIRLDFLPNTNFTEGEHYIEFSVEKLPDENGKDPGNGGRIYYNLYVE